MNPQDPLDIVRHYAALIQNGRTVSDASRHARLEHDELDEEIRLKSEGQSAGPDGIVGEAVDLMLCALDIVFVEAPLTTNEEICRIMLTKCEKWARRYKDSIDGDRTID
jgi:hypothetical protein